MAGTIAFMAPEVVESKPSDFKADVWSLGIILHHLISAKLPFSAEDREATVEQILNK
jgi:serine/threonine protein kinase